MNNKYIAPLDSSPYLLRLVLAVWLLHMAKGIVLIGASGVLFWAVDVAFWIGLPIVVLVLMRRAGWNLSLSLFTRVGPSRMPDSPRRELLIGLAAAVGIFAVDMAALAFISRSGVVSTLVAIWPNQVKYQVVANGSVWLGFYFALTAAIVEEWYCRGLLGRYFLLRDSPRVLQYVVVSTLVFASVHWAVGLANVVTASWWGLITSLFVARYRMLWPAMIAHLLVDFVLFA